MNMTKNIIQWLKKIFQQETSSTPPYDGVEDSDHVELTRQYVIEAIIRALKPMREAGNMGALILWAHDARVYSILSSDSSIQMLRLALDNAMLHSIGDGEIQVRSEIPEEQVACTAVLDQLLYFSLGCSSCSTTYKVSQCSITIHDRNGSMEKEEYVLENKGNEGMARFYIGRGASTRYNGHYHQNDIVIKTDDSECGIQALNNHVSSAHACIVAERGQFFLKALPSGCRYLKGSPTKIIHDGQVYELTDIYKLQLIHNGDIIELGRKVLLKVRVKCKSGGGLD